MHFNLVNLSKIDPILTKLIVKAMVASSFRLQLVKLPCRLRMIKHYNEIRLPLNRKSCIIHFQIISARAPFAIFEPEVESNLNRKLILESDCVWATGYSAFHWTDLHWGSHWADHWECYYFRFEYLV